MAIGEGIILQGELVVPMTQITPQLLDLQYAKYQALYPGLVEESMKAQFELLTHVE